VEHDPRSHRLLFRLCSVILVYTMYRYAGREGARSVYTHGNHRLEMVWTAVPAAILLFIAFAQIPVWNRIQTAVADAEFPEFGCRRFQGETGQPDPCRPGDRPAVGMACALSQPAVAPRIDDAEQPGLLGRVPRIR